MKLMIIATMLIGINAHAAEYRQTFLVNGKESTSEQAILASLKGAEVMKCVSVEAKVSKAGTSIGMRNVKKPRAAK